LAATVLEWLVQAAARMTCHDKPLRLLQPKLRPQVKRPTGLNLTMQPLVPAGSGAHQRHLTSQTLKRVVVSWSVRGLQINETCGSRLAKPAMKVFPPGSRFWYANRAPEFKRQ